MKYRIIILKKLVQTILILVFILPIIIFSKSKNDDNNNNKLFLRFTYPKANSTLKGRITAKGTHNYDISEHIWIILSDGFGYYVQSPEISLYEGKWEHENINLNGGVKSIIALWVNEKGHKEFLEKVKNEEWGQFYMLPPGSKKIAIVEIKNPK